MSWNGQCYIAVWGVSITCSIAAWGFSITCSIAVWVSWQETPGVHQERGATATQRFPWATWILLSAGINQSNLHMTEACPGWDWVRPNPSSKAKLSCKKLWCYDLLCSNTRSRFTAKVETSQSRRVRLVFFVFCALDSSAPAPKSDGKAWSWAQAWLALQM